MSESVKTRRQLPRALSPLRIPAYRKLTVALVLSTFATGVWTVGQVWEVIRIGGGPGQLSLVATASATGIVLPAVLGGVVADRVAQKPVLQIVAALEFACMMLVSVLSLTDTTQLWHLTAIAFLAGAAIAFYYPAYSAWLPSLVPESELQAVNGLEGTIRPTIGEAIGPAVAGVLVGAFNPGTAVAVAAVASALALLALTAVPWTPLRRDLSEEVDHPVRAALRDIREGFVYMVRTPWLLATLLFASLTILVMWGPIEVLVPFIIKDRLGGGPHEHSWVLVAFGVGGALGSLLMASIRMPRRYLTWMNVGWGVGCAPLVVIGVAGQVWLVIASAFVLGFLFAASTVIWGTLLQRRVPPALLGRVSSLDFLVSLSLLPVSMALAGPVSDAIGIRTTFIVGGVVPPVLAVAAILLWRLHEDEIAHPLD